MALLDGIAARLGYMPRPPAAAPAKAGLPMWEGPFASSAGLFGGEEERSDHYARLFSRVAWVNGAVSLTAQQAATVPLGVYQRVGEAKEAIANHPLELLLDKPNERDGRFQLFEALFGFLKLTGNSFLWLNRPTPDAPPSEMWVLPPARVEVLEGARLGEARYLYDPGRGARIPLEPWEVVHFRSFNPLSMLTGLSPLESVDDAAETDFAQRRWNRRYFDKENAKLPGALAFSDPIDNAAWETMKAEVREQWGGLRRSGPVMLRNAGKGGVQWVQMALSQQEMEFIASRNANKEEIYSVFAPGLANVLAVNATEANSVVGWRTFLGLAVWPLLVAVAQRLTNALLPAYGAGLVAEFDDVRPADQAMALSEQRAAETVLTIDELRDRFYKLPSLGDDRGNLLIAQVSAAPPLGGGERQPAPVPPALAPFAGVASAPETDEAAPPADEEAETGDMERLKALELRALKRWLKRKAGRTPLGFEAHYLSDEEKAAALKTAYADGGDRERATFERKATDALHEALRAWLRKALPSARADDFATRFADNLEREKGVFRDALYSVLLRAALMGIEGGNAALEGALRQTTKAPPSFSTAYDLANQAVIAWLLGTGDYAGAVGYVESVATLVIRHTIETARPLVASWMGDTRSLEALIADLEATGFSRARAESIAITEVTRGYARGNLAAWQASGYVDGKRWETVADEVVCPVCGGLNQQEAPLDEPFSFDGNEYASPPAHPRCRCHVTPVLLPARGGG